MPAEPPAAHPSSVAHAAAMLERQAAACGALGSPLYAALLRRVAADVRAGGPCADALAGYEDAPGDSVVGLRLMGAVHALVLTGRAPDLAAHYPSAGGRISASADAIGDAAWPAFRAAVAGHRSWIRDWLTRPPQTNEVGRANLLVTGLVHALAGADRPIRLYEIGASGGLNLLADRFRYESAGFAYGPPGSPVILTDAWRGAPPAGLAAAVPLRIVARHGCDLTPIDPRSPEGSLALRAYVWADQPARFARLAGALQLAAQTPVQVDRIGAADFLRGIDLAAGTLTVVWHSVMRQYVPADEWALVEAELARLAAAARPDAGFAYLSFEPQAGAEHHFVLTARVDRQPERVLAEALPHGLPAWTVAG